MPQLADLVKDSGTVTGTGAITLANTSSTGYITFATAFPSFPVNVTYAVKDATGANWEIGVGTLTSSTNLTRDTVTASSNAGALVSFGSAISVTVFNDASATYVERASLGRQVALRMGFAMQ